MRILQPLVVSMVLVGMLFQPEANAAETEPAKAILILDASGSMWGQIDGVAKIDIAREAVATIIDGLDENLHLGLMTYGHRKRGDCEDIELLIPPGPVDKAAMIKTVNTITPRGRTPLAASVMQAADILRYEEEKVTVILVSDGIETCDMDPCAAAEELKKNGIDFTAHVIGFDLADDEQAAIRCIADTTGGEFIAAADASSLVGALSTVMTKTVDPEAEPTPVPTPKPTPEPTPEPEATVETSKVTFRTLLSEGGEEVKSYYTITQSDAEERAGRGSGPTFDLAPGKYTVHAKSGTVQLEQLITIPSEPEHEAVLIFNAGFLKLKTLAEEGGEEVEAYYTISRAGADLSGKRPRVTANSNGDFLLSAGEYHVEAKWGTVKVEDFFEVTPNEVTEGELIAGAGVLNITASLGEGGEAVKAYFTVFGGKKKLDGSLDRITAGANDEFRLPAGDYTVEAKWGSVAESVEVEVSAGQAVNSNVVLEGGLLKTSAQDSAGQAVKAYFTIYSSKTSLSGERTRITGGASSDHQIPAGDYIVEAKIGDDTVTAEATVKTGEATEVLLKP